MARRRESFLWTTWKVSDISDRRLATKIIDSLKFEGSENIYFGEKFVRNTKLNTLSIFLDRREFGVSGGTTGGSCLLFIEGSRRV